MSRKLLRALNMIKQECEGPPEEWLFNALQLYLSNAMDIKEQFMQMFLESIQVNKFVNEPSTCILLISKEEASFLSRGFN